MATPRSVLSLSRLLAYSLSLGHPCETEPTLSETSKALWSSRRAQALPVPELFAYSLASPPLRRHLSRTLWDRETLYSRQLYSIGQALSSGQLTPLLRHSDPKPTRVARPLSTHWKPSTPCLRILGLTRARWRKSPSMQRHSIGSQGSAGQHSRSHTGLYGFITRRKRSMHWSEIHGVADTG